MTVLRSREIIPTKPNIEPAINRVNIEPATPAQTRVYNRRNTRLAPKSSSPSDDDFDDDDNGVTRKRKFDADESLLGSMGGESGGVLSLRSGRKVVKRIAESDGDREGKGKGKGKEKGKGKLVEEGDELGYVVENDEREVSEEGIAAVVGAEKTKGNQNGDESCSKKRGRRFSRAEKGKEKLVDEGLSVNGGDFIGVGLDREVMNSVDAVVADTKHVVADSKLLEETVDGNSSVRSTGVRVTESRMEQFRDIARQNASRFAYFSSEAGEENHISVENAGQVPAGEVEREIEDWPGPFSTAMKIIRDRAEKLNRRQDINSLELKKNISIPWTPTKGQGRVRPKLVPSLKDLSLKVLVQNADAISSLENVPDALRHKLSYMLCDSRRMNSHFVNLLVSGSPTEIRLRDCSWLTEEEFTEAFEKCDTSNLVVLQLDRCGRCLPDYILLSTLARSSNNLPSLTTLSLCGACRLSDVGFQALVSSAPTLRSINLSQCSLLTPTSIDILANSLGSFIQELYINDCQSLNVMLILPALKKLNCLEVLSVAGIETVTDDFVREFVSVCGHNMKELVLAGCVKLTDFSLKAIAESCPRLCTIDISNLCKLTDFAIGYLANGCRGIQTLKLCRNAFSDEAIAAFLESSGEALRELSLNNVKKVAHNTALSLARRSRDLLCLDLSWCRNLTDEAVGLIVDSCSSLRILKLFGCTQITNVFLDGHSNPEVQVIGLKMSPVLDHIKLPDFEEGPLHYSSVLSSM